MTHNPHPWAESLVTLYDHVWALLVRGVNDRRACARHLTLATVTPLGTPATRTIVLRAADRKAASLDVHTDLNSAKIADLRATPFGELHFWDTSAHLQVRLSARATLLSGNDVEAFWTKIPAGSRLAYGGTPITGQPIANALDYIKTSDPAAFVVIRMAITTMDVLHLGPAHRRARFDRADNWEGQWLVP
jgi:pyridoxamine 5'-phosphate oxidase